MTESRKALLRVAVKNNSMRQIRQLRFKSEQLWGGNGIDKDGVAARMLENL
jgi:hypothetical protein